MIRCYYCDTHSDKGEAYDVASFLGYLMGDSMNYNLKEYKNGRKSCRKPYTQSRGQRLQDNAVKQNFPLWWKYL